MNKGAKLHDGHHVIRHVPDKKLIKDDNDTNIIGFFPEAFTPRLSDNNELSVNWFEYFGGDYESNLCQSIQLFREARANSIKSKCAFGVGNVGKIKQIALSNGTSVRIIFDGHVKNPAHSLIRDLSPEDISLLELLSTEGFELIRNQDISK